MKLEEIIQKHIEEDNKRFTIQDKDHQDFNLKLDNILNKLENVTTDICEIRTQTTKTNGRVSSLEIWRGVIAGGLAVATIAIPLIIKML